MKRYALLLIIVVLSLSFMPVSQSQPTVAAQEDSGLLIWADATRTPALEPIAAQFTEEFGIQVTVQEVGMGDIRSNISVAGPAGEGPDIFIAAHDWIGEMILNGAVVPINLGDSAELFTEASLGLFTYGDELYGMPYAVENVAFFRNPELVADAPATWDDVRSISEELVANGDSTYGYLIQENDPYHYQPLMSSYGGYVFGLNDDGTYNPNDIGIDSEGAIEAGQWLQGMVEAGLLATEVDYDVMHSLFESGDAAMIVTGPWALPRLRESGVPYAISSIPAGSAGPGVPFIGGQGFMISAFSEQQLLAESFLIDYMAAMEPMQALYDADPRPPAFVPLLDSLEDPDLVAFQEAGSIGIPQPSIPEMASVWSAWGGAEAFVIRGELDAETAFTEAATTIRALIAGEPVDAGGDDMGDMGEMVGLPGTIQSVVGCDGDWLPECENTLMALGAGGAYYLTLNLPAGDYEYKVALNGGWDENYGAGGEQDGSNITLSVTEDSAVIFVYDPETHVVIDNVNNIIATAPGSYQAAAGCANDWAPECLVTWLKDDDGDGIYSFSTPALLAGDYEVKVALNLSWDLNYGVDGERDGANIAFNVPEDHSEVFFDFDSATNILTVTIGDVVEYVEDTDMGNDMGSTDDMGDMVGLPGTIQSVAGCPGDWQPECENTLMAQGSDGFWSTSLDLPAGDYEYKVALNGTWDENYGANGEAGGDNIALSLAEDATVTFVYDPESHMVIDSVNSVVATAPGNYQAAVGCANDWAPECLITWLQDADGDGVFSFSTTALPAGDYEVKVALNLSWDLNYGADAEQDGPNILFSVAADGAEVTFEYDSATNLLTVSVAE